MRVLAHPDVAEEDKGRVRALQAISDPVLLLAEIRAAQEELGRRVDRRSLEASAGEPIIVDLDRFAAGLKTAWRAGEQRPTHRRPYHRRKPVPRRACMLDDYEAEMRAWLHAEPALSAQAVLTRLIEAVPDRFTEKHLRTVQRAVRSWRGEIARSLLRNDATFLSPAPMPT